MTSPRHSRALTTTALIAYARCVVKEVNEPIRVMIVDDDAFVVDLLSMYFNSVDDIDVVASATDGAAALEKLRTIPVHVVMSDIHMPRIDGLELLSALPKQADPAPAFIAMTSIDEDKSMLEALSHGASAYIVKTAQPEFLINTVREAVRGGTVVSPQSLTRLMSFLPEGEKRSPEARAKHFPTPTELGISATEAKVLASLCEGMSNYEIAEECKITESTVKKYVSNLLKHFNAPSRLALAVTALRQGFDPGSIHS